MKFDKPKGQRLHSRFMWIYIDLDLWWSYKDRKWVKSEEMDRAQFYSSGAPCRTLRAFRSHLRKHPEIKGHATLVNRFAGYDIHG